MVRIKLVIADKDQIYLNRISNVISAKYSNKLELFAFSKLETLYEFIKENKVDVLLVSDAFEIDDRKLPEKIDFAYLVDSPNIDKLNGKKAVCKYTKIDIIYKAVLSMYSENSSNVLNFKKQGSSDTKVFSFFSCSGGDGASVLAAACCLDLAKKGKRVLYLNLEQCGTPRVFFNAEGDFGLSELVYAIKRNKVNVALKVESLVKKESNGVSFLDEAKASLDLLEMTEEDISLLMKDVVNSQLFEYIVIDTDTILTDFYISIMFNSDNIIFVSDASDVSVSKFKRVYHSLKIIQEHRKINLIEKIYMIYNKTNTMNEGGYLSDIPSVNILGKIGEYERASSIALANSISELGIFNKIII